VKNSCVHRLILFFLGALGGSKIDFAIFQRVGWVEVRNPASVRGRCWCRIGQSGDPGRRPISLEDRRLWRFYLCNPWNSSRRWLVVGRESIHARFVGGRENELVRETRRTAMHQLLLLVLDVSARRGVLAFHRRNNRSLREVGYSLRTNGASARDGGRQAQSVRTKRLCRQKSSAITVQSLIVVRAAERIPWILICHSINLRKSGQITRTLVCRHGLTIPWRGRTNRNRHFRAIRQWKYSLGDNRAVLNVSMNYHVIHRNIWAGTSVAIFRSFEFSPLGIANLNAEPQESHSLSSLDTRLCNRLERRDRAASGVITRFSISGWHWEYFPWLPLFLFRAHQKATWIFSEPFLMCSRLWRYLTTSSEEPPNFSVFVSPSKLKPASS